jgi:hypothetical protein
MVDRIQAEKVQVKASKQVKAMHGSRILAALGALATLGVHSPACGGNHVCATARGTGTNKDLDGTMPTSGLACLEIDSTAAAMEGRASTHLHTPAHATLSKVQRMSTTVSMIEYESE